MTSHNFSNQTSSPQDNNSYNSKLSKLRKLYTEQTSLRNLIKKIKGGKFLDSLIQLNSNKIKKSIDYREKERYLTNLMGWTKEKLIEKKALAPSLHKESLPVIPTIDFNDEGFHTYSTEYKLFSVFNNFLDNHKKLLLLGNGGSGKTVTLLRWTYYTCKIYLRKNIDYIPVFIPLYSLTPDQNIISLIKNNLKKHGLILDKEYIKEILNNGKLNIILDGLNEIQPEKINKPKLQEIIEFIEKYSDNSFVITSRYIESIRKFPYHIIEIKSWNQKQIKKYLSSQLDSALAEKTYDFLNENMNFNWINNCSIVGNCSNPFTLKTITQLTKLQQSTPTKDKNLVNQFVTLMLEKRLASEKANISVSNVQRLLEDFAYLMVSHGYILSITPKSALRLIIQTIKNNKNQEFLTTHISANKLLSIFLNSKLFIKENNTIKWAHQIIQETLSLQASKRKFELVSSKSNLIKCPVCGNRPDPNNFFQKKNKLFGKCSNTPKCSSFKINSLTEIPTSYKLKEKIQLIDRSKASKEPGVVSIPNSSLDRDWNYSLPHGDLIYITLLRLAQESSTTTPIPRPLLEKNIGIPKPLFEFQIWVFTIAGICELEQEEEITNIYIYPPPLNPSAQILNYELVVLHRLEPKNIKQEPEEYFYITSEKEKEYIKEREEKKLPIYHRYSFSQREKDKVFKLAKKFGGQVLRVFGPYKEVIAEFKGEAWNFSKYNLERIRREGENS